MKGRIIGREGRNIRAFESVTGVNLIIDDTPEAVLLSCFDPVRREVGRLALERLVLDGRIHPQRIEEAYEQSKAEVEQLCVRAGEDALVELAITDLHPELVTLLGRLRYRTSYGQNVLRHLVESAFIAGMMASELGMDPVLLKRCTVLHDIGKALTHEVEGSHALIGAEIARRYGESADLLLPPVRAPEMACRSVHCPHDSPWPHPRGSASAFMQPRASPGRTPGAETSRPANRLARWLASRTRNCSSITDRKSTRLNSSHLG